MKIREFLVLISIVVITGYVLMGHLSLPTIALGSDGECVYMKDTPRYEKQPCPATIDFKHLIEYVK